MTLLSRPEPAPVSSTPAAQPEPRHRAPGAAVTASYAYPFRPRHCAGTSGGECIAHGHGRPLAPVQVEDLPAGWNVPGVA